MFLSEPMDVSRYGLVYGGVQKNVGPAGVTIVIVRDDLVREDVLPFTPTIMRYKTQADAGSLSNTPPCYGIYMCGLVFKWLKEQGGLAAMRERNVEKAQLLYDYLDQSKLFKGTARAEDRSLMNVPFVTGDDELDAQVRRRGQGRGHREHQGPSQRGRHAREHLQRHAPRGRGGARALHGEVRGREPIGRDCRAAGSVSRRRGRRRSGSAPSAARCLPSAPAVQRLPSAASDLAQPFR